MRSHLASIGRSVIRGFAKSPLNRGEIGNAIYKVGKCLGDDELQSSRGADAAVVSDLLALSGLLEASIVPAPVPVPESPFQRRDPLEPEAPAPRFMADASVALADRNAPAAAAGVSASIDDLLLKLERNKDPSAPLSKAINAVFLHVLRAFGKSPPDRNEMADALDRVKECLALARARRGGPSTVVSDLERLSKVVESQFAAAARSRS